MGTRVRMTDNRRMIGALAVLSVLALLYCLAAYLRIQSVLTPAMPTPTATVNTLGAITVPALLVVGIYHLVLLMQAFRALADMRKARIVHSLYLVAVLLSGLNLLNDLTLLHDIGKEYLLLDVRHQWWMLYGCTNLHLAVVAYGSLRALSRSGKSAGPSRAVDCGSDAFYVTMHQVGLLCGSGGIVGILVVSLPGVVPDRFRPLWTLLLSGVALLPWGVILSYLLLRNRRRPMSAWFDEKQMRDTAIAALLSMMAAMVLLALLSIVNAVVQVGLPASFWLMLILFVHLIVFSCTTLARSRETD